MNMVCVILLPFVLVCAFYPGSQILRDLPGRDALRDEGDFKLFTDIVGGCKREEVFILNPKAFSFMISLQQGVSLLSVISDVSKH